MSTMTKNEARQRRKIRIRKKISGTAERPRLVIFRSNLHMYAQVVDDLTGATLAATSTLVLSKGGEKAVSYTHLDVYKRQAYPIQARLAKHGLTSLWKWRAVGVTPEWPSLLVPISRVHN